MKGKKNMKKLICALLAVVLVGCLMLPACAESIDLSSLTWEELLELKAAITMEQLSRDEWEEVEVPQGVYKVGEDIPAGKWTITCKTGYYCRFSFGEKLDDDGHSVNWNGTYDIAYIYPSSAKDGEMTQYTFEAKYGFYIVIDDAPATFTPFTGKPDLGFKKK